MKTFEEQNQELMEFDKTFDSDCFDSCVNRAYLLLKNRAAQMNDEGFIFSHKVSRWSIGQAINNRLSTCSMMSAAIKYVENVERRVEEFNGI